jgi:adenylate cyclase
VFRANAVFIALLFFLVGAIAGATGSRLVQYAILGAASGISVVLIAVHS